MKKNPSSLKHALILEFNVKRRGILSGSVVGCSDFSHCLQVVWIETTQFIHLFKVLKLLNGSVDFASIQFTHAQHTHSFNVHMHDTPTHSMYIRTTYPLVQCAYARHIHSFNVYMHDTPTHSMHMLQIRLVNKGKSL